jgi:hypothetical protein
MIHEVIVEARSLKTVGCPVVKLKVKCKYNFPMPSYYPECSNEDSTLDILSITSEDDICGLLDDDLFEEVYDTALDAVEDKMRTEKYGIPEDTFIHVEADE